MDERYEIRGKIGQGGIGAVYRAFDQRMNREVAIKRIIPEGNDADHQDEATKQLTKEAGALAALQHPHIVTVYDVGADEDGPYVVMEMLTGKSLDELVEKAPLTVGDFREVAIQTQEALIAAQDLHIVHRDIKPGNLMLTWLPSGKFQVKIVDFGLAKFTPKPSKQTLDQQDAVYGSIFFMAPEQFERGLVDGRTDLYAMGCVYYFALTGKYPFDGETGPQVMGSHLSHLVKPIGEVRPDLPPWLRDWVMWHINRDAADRPADAREALQVFLRNEGAGATMPARTVAPPPPRRPGLGTGPVQTVTATQSAPQSLQPPDGSRPSVHTTSHVLTKGPATSSVQTHTRPVTPIPQIPKKKMSNAAKAVISGILGLGVIIVGMTIMKGAEKEKQEKALQALIDKAADPAKELEVTSKQLKSLFDNLKVPKQLAQHAPTMRAIRLAKSSSFDVDADIAKFVTSSAFNNDEDLRQMFFRDVVGYRDKFSAIGPIIAYARAAKEKSSADAALESIRRKATDDHFDALLETIESAQLIETKRAAVRVATDVVTRSSNRGVLRGKIEQLVSRAKDDIKGDLIGLKNAASD
ncbi:protein kinase [Luteolibacter sp. LG18]|uniref:protein kinase domain-containing protein n=1 Tax=Luteolibacter sp. LG18 TaxID=2819286 RepID=UPI002B280FEE|nr:hypothetical protein llg_17980 [Luteolibacter sp. LG18]